MSVAGILRWGSLVLGALVFAAAAAPAELVRRGEVAYVSGGVGEEARKRIEARSHEFNLKLVFMLEGGDGLADVAVAIRDRAGRPVLRHVTEGPVLLARLPAGSYTVSATYRGREQTRKVGVARELRTETFRWPPAAGSGPAVAAREPPQTAATPGADVISGGIGEDELARLAAQERHYNLKLVLTLVEGNYVSDVRVTLTDAQGRQVLEHVAAGPVLLARLPAGRYTVAATYEGRTLRRKLVLGERLRTEYLRWPADPAADLPVSRWTEK